MTIPALNDGGRWVGDSTRIALYLDDAYPDLPPLLSADPVLRAQQLHLNRLAESLGVLVRQHAMIYLINTPVPPHPVFSGCTADRPVAGRRNLGFSRRGEVTVQDVSQISSPRDRENRGAAG